MNIWLQVKEEIRIKNSTVCIDQILENINSCVKRSCDSLVSVGKASDWV